ncbi:homoserine kinase [Holzapfeliella sp. He02]|uniref:Homoserine kinase n=1 Tax=Holzapfeliella saturejae TaxID=3082953 RepID=A0ABU8SHQ0_9LACO
MLGCDSTYQNDSNLVYQAFVKGCDYLGQEVPHLKLTIDSDIPVSRGLGSSASCIVAGIKAAGLWFDQDFTNDRLVKLATQIEKHPDNIAPAVYGKLCSAFLDGDKVELTQYEVSSDLKFTAIIPDYKMSTKEARQALPKQLTYADITFQISHSLALVQALAQGDFEKLAATLKDKMHQPYRTPLIKEYDEIEQIAKSHDSLIYLSGSGSTMMFISPNDEKRAKIVKVLTEKFAKFTVKPIEVEQNGIVAKVQNDKQVLYSR